MSEVNNTNNQNNNIVLYPSNWLYNAGVVGFLRVISNIVNDNLIKESGEVIFSKELLENILKSNEFKLDNFNDWRNYIPKWHYYYIMEGSADNLKERKDDKDSIKENNEYLILKLLNDEKKYYSKNDIEKDNSLPKEFKDFLILYRKYAGKLFSKNCIYLSQYAPSKLKNIDKFIKEFPNIKNEIKSHTLYANDKNERDNCFFCNSNNYSLSSFNNKFMSLLMPSKNEFPNSYWNNHSEGINKICSLCQFIIIHHHLSFTKLSDGSEIFINAPSFKLMYELNKLVKILFGKTDVDSTKKREILAMSVIEYTRRLQTTLGQWNAMNIEIVIKYGDLIDYYTLPYETIRIISEREISSILSDLGEFCILDCIISGNYSFLQEISYKLIRAAIKSESISSFIKLKKNQDNIILTAQKILKLYSTIIDRRKQYARTK